MVSNHAPVKHEPRGWKAVLRWVGFVPIGLGAGLAGSTLMHWAALPVLGMVWPPQWFAEGVARAISGGALGGLSAFVTICVAPAHRKTIALCVAALLTCFGGAIAALAGTHWNCAALAFASSIIIGAWAVAGFSLLRGSNQPLAGNDRSSGHRTPLTRRLAGPFRQHPWLLFVAGGIGIGVCTYVLNRIWLERRIEASSAYLLRIGRESVPEIAQFEQLFPNLEHIFIEGEPETRGTYRWEFKAGLHRRYVVVMNLDISLGPSHPICFHSEPEFEVWEAVSASGGKCTSVLLKEFGRQEWQTLADAGGDLIVLGIEVTRNAPVPGFQGFAKNNE